MAHGPVVFPSAQESWFTGINHFARSTSWLHAPAEAYAKYGVAVFALLMLVSWWKARNEGDLAKAAAALWAPVGMLIALGLNQFLVSAFSEERPYTVFPDALTLVARSADPSFPSDHSVVVGAVAVGVLLVHRRLGLVTAALAVLMAAARVYVGAHWPLDVVAGLAVGAVLALASYLLVRPLLGRIVNALAGTPIRTLLTARPA
jgi:undecaprenyl-diphosphatase